MYLLQMCVIVLSYECFYTMQWILSIGKHDRAKIDINHHEFGKPLVESTYRSLSSFHCSLKVT